MLITNDDVLDQMNDMLHPVKPTPIRLELEVLVYEGMLTLSTHIALLQFVDCHCDDRQSHSLSSESRKGVLAGFGKHVINHSRSSNLAPDVEYW